MLISIVAALDEAGLIGARGRLPWRLRGDPAALQYPASLVACSCLHHVGAYPLEHGVKCPA